MSKTAYFKNYVEFVNREDKSLNGTNRPELVSDIDDNNIGCWNCENCSGCEYCIECKQCTNCRHCSDCEYCVDCEYCRLCSDCEYCRHCGGLSNVEKHFFNLVEKW